MMLALLWCEQCGKGTSEMDFAYVKTPTTTFSKERQRKKQSKKTKNHIPLFLLHYTKTRYRASCPALALDNLCATVLHVFLPARD